MNKSKVVVIGSGPAGLGAAIAGGEDVVVIDGNPEAGKKLLISGSGQCNLTNSHSLKDFINNCGKSGHFLKPALYNFDNQSFIDLLENHDCLCQTREDGKVFPISLLASDVRDTLVQIAISRGATFIFNEKVTDIIKLENKFAVKSTLNSFLCDKLIIAGGGCSYPQTGSDGSCYGFAAKFGHSVLETHPALTSIELEDFEAFIECAGISIPQAHVKFITAGRSFHKTGDLLFTHNGLSGPVILDNASQLNSSDVVQVRLLNNASAEIQKALEANPSKRIINALQRISMPETQLRAVMNHLQINPLQLASQFKRKDFNQLIDFLQAAHWTIKQVGSIRTAMATAGGVKLSEVNSHTLESKLEEGLYFAGEILAYDLPSGGYNIQAAFSTGYLAGISAKKELPLSTK